MRLAVPSKCERKMKITTDLEQAVNEFRQMLPGQSATAQAIDRREAWERIMLNAVEDGYIEFADELGAFLEASLRRSF